LAQILEKTSIWEFGLFAKKNCQIMRKCMDKQYLPNFFPSFTWEIYGQTGPYKEEPKQQ